MDRDTEMSTAGRDIHAHKQMMDTQVRPTHIPEYHAAVNRNEILDTHIIEGP